MGASTGGSKHGRRGGWEVVVTCVWLNDEFIELLAEVDLCSPVLARVSQSTHLLIRLPGVVL